MTNYLETDPNKIENSLSFNDIKEKLIEVADSVTETDGILSHEEDGDVVAEVVDLTDKVGNYASILSDKTGKYSEALEDLALNYEGVEFRNGNIEAFEP